MRKMVLAMIWLYRQLISPLFASRCRFYPSCSQYCYEAVEHYGVIKGLLLGGKRLAKCHPFSAGGYDPLRADKSS